MNMMSGAIGVDRNSTLIKSLSHVSRHSRRAAIANLSEAVAQAIVARLRMHTYREMRSLSVGFSNGVVTLRGRVTTYYFKQIAQESIRRIAGIVKIINLVDVRYVEPRSGANHSSNQGNIVDGTA